MTAMSADFQSTPQSKPVVLVIDDSSMSRKMLSNILKPEGYEIIQGINGVEAIELFEKHKPDVVLLDVVMPVMDGLEACARIKKLPGGDRTPVFIITSLATKDAISRAFEAGAVDYFSKPPNEAVIAQRIRRVLEAKKWENALIASEQRLQTITATMGEGLYVLDALGKVVYLNPEAEYILGWNPADLLGKKPCETFYPQIDCNKLDDTIHDHDDFVERRESPLFWINYNEREYTRSNGERFPVSCVARDFPDASGCVIVFADITAKKRAEEQLRQDIFLASRIQQELLPREFSGKTLTVETVYKPASHVSGDFFDYAWSPDGKRFSGYIADVMGHGIATALQAAALRVVFHMATDTIVSPDVRLTSANKQVFSCFAAGSFAGALCFEFDMENRILTYSAAGINDFLVLSANQPKRIEVPGHFLGIIKNNTYPVHTLKFEPGDSFFFMTDGISEHLPENWAEYSYQDLRHLLELFAKQSADDATAVCVTIPKD